LRGFTNRPIRLHPWASSAVSHCHHGVGVILELLLLSLLAVSYEIWRTASADKTADRNASDRAMLERWTLFKP
jgi:hypothetical protein